ncbi:MAG: hypothetical protein H3C41_04905 [Bacteroidales bacterium]|nr:hypothetical protein [Bacteroidales bacterium]
MKRNKTLFSATALSRFLLVVLPAAILMSCGHKKPQAGVPSAMTDESKALTDYFTANGVMPVLKNSGFLMSAAELNKMADTNIIVIDLRNAELFAAGHIGASVNLSVGELLHYFESVIDPPSFKRIVLVDARGQNAAYAAALMRLTGYDNVYALRFGMSAWNKKLAETGWDLAVGDTLSNVLDLVSHPKNPLTGHQPQLSTGGHNALSVARLQTEHLFAKETPAFLLDFREILKSSENYLLISLGNEEAYQAGHLPGAIHYSFEEFFNAPPTLPVDKPIVLYSLTGHSAAAAVAWLRMLGYDAYSVYYGASSFMNQSLLKLKSVAPQLWSLGQTNDFSLTAGQAAKASGEIKITKAAKGGC